MRTDGHFDDACTLMAIFLVSFAVARARFAVVTVGAIVAVVMVVVVGGGMLSCLVLSQLTIPTSPNDRQTQ